MGIEDIKEGKDFICDLCQYEDHDDKPCSDCCVLNSTDYFKLKTEIKEMIQSR